MGKQNRVALTLTQHSEFYSPYFRPAQLRKLERPNYRRKFAAGRKRLFHFDVEISL